MHGQQVLLLIENQSSVNKIKKVGSIIFSKTHRLSIHHPQCLAE